MAIDWRNTSQKKTKIKTKETKQQKKNKKN